MSVTRRSLLLGAAAAATGLVVVSGCRDDEDEPRSAGLSAEDRSALAAAIDAERQIVAMYEARLDDGVTTKLAYDQHVEHLGALQRIAGTSTPSASPAADPGGEIAPLVLSGAKQLQDSAIGATDGALAVVLASVAAAHLTRPPKVFEAEFYGRDGR